MGGLFICTFVFVWVYFVHTFFVFFFGRERDEVSMAG